jgi:ABC-type phosphate/phosphonate transport system substrate-binding protein
MFGDLSPVVVQAAATPFSELLKKQTGLDGEVKVVDGCETLARRLDDKTIHFGVFHGFEWAWLKDRYPKLVPLVVTVPHQHAQACLVVHVDSKAQKPHDLKGECVTVPFGTKAHCRLYIERLQQDLPAGRCCPRKLRDQGSDDALDSVVTGKCDAVLVDAAALTAYQDNKPGPASQLRVLCKSEPFPPTVVVYREGGVDPATVKKIKTGLINSSTTSQGRAFMFLWKLKGFEAVPAGYDDQLKKIHEAFPPPQPEIGMSQK